MANTYSNSQLVVFKSLARWKNKLKFAGNTNLSYSKEFGKAGAKVGSSIAIRKPQRWAVSNGQSASIQGIQDLTIPLTMTIQSNVAYSISSAERYLSADDIMERYGAPAIDALANAVDFNSLAFATAVTPNWSGTLGVLPTTNDIWLQAGVNMDNQNTPDTSGFRNMLVSPSQMKQAVLIDQTLFNHSGKVGEQYKTGQMYDDVHGFDWFKSQNVAQFTVGTYGGTPVINGAAQTGSTLILNGFSAGSRLNMGDRFKVAGMFQANAQNRVSNGTLQGVVVTAPAVADGAGNMTVQIYPPLFATGAYQNVSNAPATGAALTIWAASGTTGTTGLAFGEDAFAVVYGKLGLPTGAVIETHEDQDPDTKVNIRYIMDFDSANDLWFIRWDILYGFGALYAEHANVVATN